MKHKTNKYYDVGLRLFIQSDILHAWTWTIFIRGRIDGSCLPTRENGPINIWRGTRDQLDFFFTLWTHICLNGWLISHIPMRFGVEKFLLFVIFCTVTESEFLWTYDIRSIFFLLAVKPRQICLNNASPVMSVVRLFNSLWHATHTQHIDADATLPRPIPPSNCLYTMCEMAAKHKFVVISHWMNSRTLHGMQYIIFQLNQQTATTTVSSQQYGKYTA